MKVPKYLTILTAMSFVVGLLSPAGFLSAQPGESRITIASDGWRLVGDLQMPQARGLVPAVLLLNKANGTRAAYSELSKELARNGIASLRLDLRAHGESTNKGTFGPPFDEPMLRLLAGSENDVMAALSYLRNLKGIDPQRLGVVGASYSGEQMAVAARKSGYAKAYVALSPGSFGEESIKAIDGSGARWLFVRSTEEPHLKGLHEDIRKQSKTAELLEVAGNKHATVLLDSAPGVAEMITGWLKRNL
jgi:dienelactone hydrolase